MSQPLGQIGEYVFKIPVVLLSRNCPVFPGLKLYHPREPSGRLYQGPTGVPEIREVSSLNPQLESTWDCWGEEEILLRKASNFHPEKGSTSHWYPPTYGTGILESEGFLPLLPLSCPYHSPVRVQSRNSHF